MARIHIQIGWIVKIAREVRHIKRGAISYKSIYRVKQQVNNAYKRFKQSKKEHFKRKGCNKIQ